MAAATDLIEVDRTDPRRIAIVAYASPFEHGKEVIELLGALGTTPGIDPVGMHLIGHAAACVGDFARARAIFIAAAAGLRDQGRLIQLAGALRLLGFMSLRCGRWDGALVAAAECVRLTQDIRQPMIAATRCRCRRRSPGCGETPTRPASWRRAPGRAGGLPRGHLAKVVEELERGAIVSLARRHLRVRDLPITRRD